MISWSYTGGRTCDWEAEVLNRPWQCKFLYVITSWSTQRCPEEIRQKHIKPMSVALTVWASIKDIQMDVSRPLNSPLPNFWELYRMATTWCSAHNYYSSHHSYVGSHRNYHSSHVSLRQKTQMVPMFGPFLIVFLLNNLKNWILMWIMS